jgi:hypothetical protein
MKGCEARRMGLFFMPQGPIAQLVEPPAHNRSVPGSNPGGPTTDKEKGGEWMILFFRIVKDQQKKKQRGTKKCTVIGAFFLIS